MPAGFVRPRILRKVEPAYPEAARAAHLEADVPVRIVVDATGRVVDPHVLAPAGHGFDEAALAAMRQFLFSPARVGGTPVPVRVTYVVRFHLERVPASAPASQSRAALARAATQPSGAPSIVAVLRGRVRERGTANPLPDAEIVAVPALGGPALVRATTDDAGRFELELPQAGDWIVHVAAAAHAALRERETLAPHQALEVLYTTERTDYSDYRTVVHVQTGRTEVSRSTLQKEEIEYIPGTNGDALRSVETMPGVARAPFNAGLLVIEGSGPADSDALIAGGTVPQLFHFFALSSVFASELIDHIDYLPANFGPRYGRATGGVVDVEPRAGRADRLHGFGDVNLVDASAEAEGPVGDGSFALAARRSTVDLWLPYVLRRAGASLTEAPVYFDYQGELTQKLAGGTFNLLAFGSDDQIRLVLHDPGDIDPAVRGAFETHLYFHRLAPSWDFARGPLTIHASLQTGPSHQEIGLGTTLGYSVDTWDTQGRLDLAARVAPWLKLEGGLDVLDTVFSAQLSLPHPPEMGGVEPPLGTQPIVHVSERSGDFQPALWYQLDLEPVHGLLVMPGVRFDYDSYLGKASADPRLAVRWKVAPATVLKGGVGVFHEAPRPPYYIDRQFGNPDLPFERAIQSSLGVEQDFAPSLHLDLTGFYKWLDDLPAPSTGFVARGGQVVPEWYGPTEIGRVYGLEFLARKALSARWYGWIAYTLEKAERRDAPGQPWHPFTFDQTHILTVLASYKITPRWQLGARVLYSTGNVQTPILGGIYNSDADVYVPIPGPEDSMRMPAYFELDVRLDRRFLFDAWTLDAYLDVLNALDTQNVEGYTYGFDDRTRQAVNGLPIIPSIGVRGEF